MAVVVVVGLEVVDVHHQQPQRCARPYGCLDFGFERFGKRTPVAHAGQGVDPRHHLHLVGPGAQQRLTPHGGCHIGHLHQGVSLVMTQRCPLAHGHDVNGLGQHGWRVADQVWHVQRQRRGMQAVRQHGRKPGLLAQRQTARKVGRHLTAECVGQRTPHQIGGRLPAPLEEPFVHEHHFAGRIEHQNARLQVNQCHQRPGRQDTALRHGQTGRNIRRVDERHAPATKREMSCSSASCDATSSRNASRPLTSRAATSNWMSTINTAPPASC